MSSLKSVLYFVCLFVLSCFLFILPLLISPCPHFWSEFMASRDRLWRDYLKACFSGVFRCRRGQWRSLPLISLKYLRQPWKRYHVPPPVFCLFILVGTITKTILLHPYFFIKNIFVAFSLFVKINTIFRYIAPSKLDFTTFITVLWVTQSKKLEKLNIQNNLRTISLTSTILRFLLRPTKLQ